jgi:hypothetical protein
MEGGFEGKKVISSNADLISADLEALFACLQACGKDTVTEIAALKNEGEFIQYLKANPDVSDLVMSLLVSAYAPAITDPDMLAGAFARGATPITYQEDKETVTRMLDIPREVVERAREDPEIMIQVKKIINERSEPTDEMIERQLSGSRSTFEENLYEEIRRNRESGEIKVTKESPEYQLLLAADKFLETIDHSRFASDITRVSNITGDDFHLSRDFANDMRMAVLHYRTCADFKRYPAAVADFFDAMDTYEQTKGYIKFDNSELHISKVRVHDQESARHPVVPDEVDVTVVTSSKRNGPVIRDSDGVQTLVYIEGFGRESGITAEQAAIKLKEDMANQMTCFRRMIAGQQKEAHACDLVGVSFNASYYSVLAEMYRMQADPEYYSERAKLVAEKIVLPLIEPIPPDANDGQRAYALERSLQKLDRLRGVNFSYGTCVYGGAIRYLEKAIPEMGYTDVHTTILMRHLVSANHATLVNLDQEAGRTTSLHVVRKDQVVENRTTNLDMSYEQEVLGMRTLTKDNMTVLYPTSGRATTLQYIHDFDDPAEAKVTEREFPTPHHFRLYFSPTGTKLDDESVKVVPAHAAADIGARFLRSSFTKTPERLIDSIRDANLLRLIEIADLNLRALEGQVTLYGITKEASEKGPEKV